MITEAGDAGTRGAETKDVRAKTILVVGGSRGIGAASVRRFAQDGARVILTYNSRAGHAQRLIGSLPEGAGPARALPLDLSDADAIANLADILLRDGERLDVLIISAAGGMERGKPEDYARNLNAAGPLNLVRALLPLCRPGAVVLLVTSHEAHFHGQKAVYQPYAHVAETKKAGELNLLNAQEELERCGVTLKILSADVVEDSPTAKLIELQSPGFLEDRRKVLGRLPTSDDVAIEVCSVAGASCRAFGAVTFVWEPVGFVA